MELQRIRGDDVITLYKMTFSLIYLQVPNRLKRCLQATNIITANWNWNSRTQDMWKNSYYKVWPSWLFTRLATVIWFLKFLMLGFSPNMFRHPKLCTACDLSKFELDETLSVFELLEGKAQYRLT